MYARTRRPSASTFGTRARAMLPKPTRPSVCPRSRGRPGSDFEAPAPFARRAVKADDPPCARKEQGQRMVRNLRGAEVGHVRDEDPELGGTVDWNVVDPYAVSRDDAASRGGLECGGRNTLPVRENGVGFRRHRDDLVFAPRFRDEKLCVGFRENPPLDVERRPGVVGDENGAAHSLAVVQSHTMRFDKRRVVR